MKVTINSATGNLEADFPADRPLTTIKRDAMSQLKLDPSDADQYAIAKEGGMLDESKSLAELGLPENVMLILWRTGAVKGGTARTWDRSNER